MRRLTICVRQVGPGRSAVTVAGEIDLTTVGELDESVSSLFATGTCVALDYSGVTFMDSVGLKFLLKHNRLAKDRGGRLFLCAPSEQVITLLGLAEVIGVLDIRDDVQTALVEAGPGHSDADADAEADAL